MKFLIVALACVAVACAQIAPSNEYLPPTELSGLSSEYLAPQESAVLADDGYRYRTVRRHRHRRDVSELTSYLPPAQEATELAPSNEYLPPQESAVLAQDGYRYKTVRRQRRRRREVNQLTSYLPPAQEAVEYAPELAVEAAPVQDSAIFADDGYRYKTVRRQRRRRQVDALTSYLPPAQEAIEYAPSNEYLPPQESAVLAQDGYRYKTVRRQRRRRREVNQLTSYLPPAQEAIEYAPELSAEINPIQAGAIFANDGYRYKTVRRQRRRREVDQLTSYLPPAQEVSADFAATEIAAPSFEQGTFFGNDGYRYKTVKRFRSRRH